MLNPKPTLYGRWLYSRPLYSETDNTAYLIDTLTLSDSLAKSVIHPFIDRVSFTDLIASNPVHPVIDTILLQDWASITVTMPSIWNATVLPEASQTLYGITLYSKNLYSSSQLQVWQALENQPPTGNWSNKDN